MLFSADYMITEKLEQALESKIDWQIFMVNDVNDHTKQSMGKSQDSHLLHSLSDRPVEKVKGLLGIDMPKVCLFSSF